MDRVFVTGGSGFLGSGFLPALAAGGTSVVALDRSGRLAAEGGSQEDLEVVHGDLLDPATWARALSGTETVVHLAAATGKASATEHFAVNARGTELLLESCRHAGVRRFLFVSSIAVKFPDKTYYHYAQAKEQAEETVRASGLEFVIVRPTIIIDRASALLAALRRLAGLPIVPVFGSGRVRVQPIYLGDLVRFLVAIVEEGLFTGETLELGGPTVLTIEDLLQEIRRTEELRRARIMRIPLRPLVPFLGLVERVGVSRLPVTAGQLASFRFDGTIEPSPLYESRRETLKTVPEMLSLSLAP